jgi:hypothetical protein
MKTSLSQQQIIESYLSNPKKIRPNCNNIRSFVRQQREHYETMRTPGIFHDSAFLSSPPKRKLNITAGDKRNGRDIRWIGYNGIWKVTVERISSMNRFEFTIVVIYGQKKLQPFYHFCPLVIDEDVTSALGNEFYQ